MLSDTQLIQRLCDGRYHSGSALGAEANISRMAIWKAIQRIKAQGLQIESCKGRGYRLLEPLELLSQEQVVSLLPARIRAHLSEIEVLQSVDSTNTYLMRVPAPVQARVCLAERQLAGRGRRERTWVSPFGANLYLSLLWRFEETRADFSSLSLACAVAITRALTELGVESIGIKWPNDLYWQGRKLGGILLEMTGEAAGPCRLVIGVGLNVHMPTSMATQIDQAWVDLREALGGVPVSRNTLAAHVVTALVNALIAFEADGFQSFEQDWRRFDLAAGRKVLLLHGGEQIPARALGIDASGRLKLEINGRTEVFSSGEISLRLDE